MSDKLAKLERFDHKVIRIDVEVSRKTNPRRSDQSDRIELTVHSKGPVVRAEAAADDRYAALDIAVERLMTRLRKAADRRRVHHGNRTPLSVRRATAAANGAATRPMASRLSQRGRGATGRCRRHRPDGRPGENPPGQSDDPRPGLYEMELVGHDFYLFVDADTKAPSVVYRRRGYDYGVIHLDV